MGWGAFKKHYICVCGGAFFSVQLCVCSNIFSETTVPTEAKFHVEPPWDRRGKFIQMVQVIIVNLRGAEAFCRDFTINVSPQCRAFSRALKTEKVKSPAIPRPRKGRDYKWLVHKWIILSFFLKMILKARVLSYGRSKVKKNFIGLNVCCFSYQLNARKCKQIVVKLSENCSSIKQSATMHCWWI